MERIMNSKYVHGATYRNLCLVNYRKKPKRKEKSHKKKLSAYFVAKCSIYDL